MLPWWWAVKFGPRYKISFAAYCRRDHPLAAKGQIALMDLLPSPFIL
jgi:hypothetical protein